MTNKIEEQLSALVDGETGPAELAQVLQGLRDDPALRERWSRYNLISDALRKNLPPRPDHGFADRIHQAIEKEPTVLAPRVRKPFQLPNPLKQAVGLAVAASVTAVAILGFQGLYGNDPVPMASVPAPDQYVRIAGAPAAPASAEEEKRKAALDPYLVNHNEHSVSSGMQGMLPYVRIVSHGSEQ